MASVTLRAVLPILSLALTANTVRAELGNDLIRRYLELDSTVAIREEDARRFLRLEHDNCEALACARFLSLLRVSHQVSAIIDRVVRAATESVEGSKSAAREFILTINGLNGNAEVDSRGVRALATAYSAHRDRAMRVPRLCLGYNFLPSLRCEVKFSSAFLANVRAFIDYCEQNAECGLDAANAVRFRQTTNNRFLRAFSYMRMFKNFDDEILPSLLSQLSEIDPEYKQKSSAAMACLKSLDERFHIHGLKHRRDPKCSPSLPPLSSSGQQRLARFAELMKSVKSERPMAGNLYSRTACYTDGQYACNVRAQCLKDYLADNGLEESFFIVGQADKTLYDTKKRMPSITQNIRHRGVSYSMHAVLAVRIEGRLYVLDHLHGDSPTPFEQWSNAFDDLNEIGFVIEDSRKQTDLVDKSWRATQHEILNREDVGEIGCEAVDDVTHEFSFWSARK